MIMIKQRKHILLLIFTLLIALSFSGCKKEDYAKYYDVYYMNSEENGLVSLSYGTNETDSAKTMIELLTKMNTAQKSDNLVVIKKENILVQNYYINNNIAYLYFSQEYYSMEPSRQALFRGAVVKTLTQIEGVDYVMIFVNDTPITYSDGTVIGMMSANDFIDDDDNNVSNLQWSDLTLYFANTKGDKLVKQNVSIAYSKNISVERAIVEQLINGPDDANYARTLPESLKLLNVSVKDGVCYVNLDATFLTDIVNVSTTIPIYSIVNSLCELDNIDKVQFLINGDSKKVFRESISLDTQFELNMDIIS